MSSTHRGSVRVEHDFYATPAWCVHRLLDRVILPSGTWLEPAAGDGAIVRAISDVRPGVVQNRRIASIDWVLFEIRHECMHRLAPLGQASCNDFLAGEYDSEVFDVIITNPPFSLAMDFIRHSLPLAPHVAMLLRLNFLGSLERSRFFRAEMPDLYVLPNRPSFTGLGSDSIEYAWFVWGEERGRRTGKIELLDDTPKEERTKR